MVTIYSKHNSPRLTYVLKVVFSDVLMIDYTLVNDIHLLQNINGIKINYSDEEINDSLHILPSGLLEENKITQKVIKTGLWKNVPTLFVNDKCDIPFDIFSAVFYIVSRYEEYLPFVPDMHGRFEADKSIAANKNFLHIPVVDLWCKLLAEHLNISSDCKGIQPSNYKFRLTIDIDRAWKYKNAGKFLTIALLFRDFITFRTKQLKERILVLTNRIPDPYFTFDFLETVENQLKEKIRFFILCGKPGKFDDNISMNNKEYKQLINRLFKKSTIGLHPSYNSNNTFEVLQEEHRSLEKYLNQKIFHSRQHYLKLTFPTTYRRLIKLGILHDYTMGYSNISGFRAGIARPFFFYDLTAEKQTDLRVIPFQIMDRTLLSYMKLTPEEAIKEIEYYSEIIHQIGGYFVALWHNSSLSNQGEWKGWLDVFNKLIIMNRKDDTISST